MENYEINEMGSTNYAFAVKIIVLKTVVSCVSKKYVCKRIAKYILKNFWAYRNKRNTERSIPNVFHGIISRRQGDNDAASEDAKNTFNFGPSEETQ